MKYRDLMTGNVLEPGSAEVEAQFAKYTDRYEPVVERRKRGAKDDDSTGTPENQA